MPIPQKPLNLSRLQNLNVKLPKKNNATTMSDLSGKLKAWSENIRPETVSPTTMKVKAMALTKENVNSFARVQRAPFPLQELAQKQNLSVQEYSGIFFTSLVAHQFLLMERSHQSARPTARTTEGMLKRKEKNYERLSRAYLRSLAQAGLPNLAVDDLKRMAKTLTAKEENYDSYLSVLSTAGRIAQPALAPSNITIISPSYVVGKLDRVFDYEIVVPPNWCGLDPIEGVYTKNWSTGFSYRQSYTYPCGVDCDWDWFESDCDVKYCTSSFVLIAGSVSFSLEVGYKIDCCGAAAWGSVTSEACGTLAGATLCASCTGSVVTVAGVGRTRRADGQCVYGLGVNVNFSCKIAGIRVISGSKPIGWNVVGMCPPFNLC